METHHCHILYPNTVCSFVIHFMSSVVMINIDSLQILLPYIYIPFLTFLGESPEELILTVCLFFLMWPHEVKYALGRVGLKFTH